ncbi:MAG: hypothetical protein R6U62_02900, partial [Bacteroidales bacterium]
HALGIGVETASNTLVQPDYPLILIIGGNKSQPPATGKATSRSPKICRWSQGRQPSAAGTYAAGHRDGDHPQQEHMPLVTGKATSRNLKFFRWI